ncbi:hypothetical protein EDC96DRAFT_496781 [Choanephora cucurbitarum]|nr:hypothetical protein EDC96DRAFT_496781 [Choanephora cucurbitarum]
MNRILLCIAITLVALECYLVNAHFTLTYPSSRGFDESKESTAPCGNFDSVSSTRVKLPKSAFVEINSGHVSYSYVINAVYSNNPSTNDFSGSSLKQLATGTRSYPQNACLPFQFGDDVENGTNATIQVEYNGGDGILYQCFDATYDNTATLNTTACVNADGSATNLNSSSSSAPSASASNNNTSLGSSVTAATGLTMMAAFLLSLLLA